VVDLQHHPALHHAAGGVFAECRESSDVALCVSAVRGDLLARRELLLGFGRRGVADGVVVLGPGALLRLPVGARRQELADVDGRSERARVVADTAQRVVELVAQEHAAHAQRIQLVQALVDVRLAALRDVEDLLAAEGLGGLDAEDDRQLALLDDLTGLRAVGDDPEPALAGPAVHLVDEGLHVVRQLGLEPDGRHLVAAAVLEKVHGADDAVGDEVVDQHPLAAAPGPFHPGVVVLLVGQRVVGGPVLEGGPAVRVVFAVATLGDEVEDRERAVRIVLGAVLERVRDALLGERLSADKTAAEGLVGENVVVRVDEAAHLALGVGAGEGLARDVDPGIRRGPCGGDPPVGAGRRTRRRPQRDGQHEQEERHNGDVLASVVRASGTGHSPRPSVGGMAWSTHRAAPGPRAGKRRPGCHDLAQAVDENDHYRLTSQESGTDDLLTGNRFTPRA
jgi:hypothetical protein